MAGLFGFLLLAGAGVTGACAQDSWAGQEGSTQEGPTLDEYLKENPSVKLVPFTQMKIDGKSVLCGKRPMVLNSNFDSWGGAFPGFIIINPAKGSGLSTEVKLFIFGHECGHQFEGPGETQADLFSIRRGVKWGWLDDKGMDDICAFISTLKGDAVHPPGPERCTAMRTYYNELKAEEKSQTAASAPPAPAAKKAASSGTPASPAKKAQTLAPAE